MTTHRRTLIVVSIGALIAVAALLVYQVVNRDTVRGMFDVGGRSLYLECVGEGKPTIVMDAGSGGDHTTWKRVVREVRGTNQTCTYDRANIGASDDASAPRTSADVVADLQRLLHAADISGPYLLVGHSFGGISMRLYAATHPDEVLGVVLVDPTPETFVTDACEIVDDAACATIRADFEPPGNEGIDIAFSAEALMTTGPIPEVPMVILAADNHQMDMITDPMVQRRFEEMWQRQQSQLAADVATARVEVVASGHDIQAVHPEAVVDAIRSVLSDASASSPVPSASGSP